MRPIHLISAVALLLALGVAWLAFSGSDKEPVRPAALTELDEPNPEHDDSLPRSSVDSPADRDVLPNVDPSVDPARPSREAPPREPTLTVSVRGRVLDERGSGVGARILFGRAPGSLALPLDAPNHPAALRGERIETTSGQNGAFAFEIEVAPGESRHSLAVRSPGHADLDLHGILLPLQPTHDLMPLTLARGVTVEGRVVDEVGRGVGGATLRRGFPAQSVAGRGLPATVGVEVSSAHDGTFRMNSLSAGPLVLVVESEGRAGAVWQGLAERPGDVVRDVVIVLASGSSIAGRVVSADGRPVSDATVVIVSENASADTDAQGGFRLAGLSEAEAYVLRARTSERPRPPRWLTEPVEVRADMNAVLVVAPAAAVRLRVVRERGAEPLSPDAVTTRAVLPGGAVEEIELAPSAEWHVDPEGGVRVPRLFTTGRESSVALVVRALGRSATSREFTPVAGRELDLGELVLGDEAAVRARVVEGASGAPVEGARVHLEPLAGPDADEEFVRAEWGLARAGSKTAATDAAGLAVVDGPRGRRCRLWAEDGAGSGALSPSREVVVVVGADAGVVHELALGEPTAAVALVVDANGAPLEGRVVQQSFRRGDELAPSLFRRIATDREGRARFAGLAPGEHRFELVHATSLALRAFAALNPEASADGAFAVRIVPGREVEVRMVAAPVVSLSGTVTAETAPLAGATVRVYADRREALDAEAGFSAPSEFGSVADGNGRYRIEGLVPGRYAVVVAHSTRAMSQHFELVVRDRNTRCDLDLEVLVVWGRVATPEGEPFHAARVRVERVSDVELDLPDWLFHDLSSSAARGTATPAVATGPDGRFELTGLDASGPLRLVAEGDWLVPIASEPFGFPAGENRVRVDLVTQQGGALRARVESASGAREGYQLEAFLLDATGALTERRTSRPSVADGALALSGLRPGVHRVSLLRVTALGSPSDPVEVRVEANRTVELVFPVE